MLSCFQDHSLHGYVLLIFRSSFTLWPWILYFIKCKVERDEQYLSMMQDFDGKGHISLIMDLDIYF